MKAAELRRRSACAPRRGEARIGDQLGRAQHGEQFVPVLLVDQHEAQPALPGFVDAMAGGEAELHAVDARPLEALAVRRRHRVRGVEQRRVDDRGVDELAFAGAVAVIERLRSRRPPTGSRCRCRRRR